MSEQGVIPTRPRAPWEREHCPDSDSALAPFCSQDFGACSSLFQSRKEGWREGEDLWMEKTCVLSSDLLSPRFWRSITPPSTVPVRTGWMIRDSAHPLDSLLWLCPVACDKEKERELWPDALGQGWVLPGRPIFFPSCFSNSGLSLWVWS